jgi:hypothetical protein
MGPTAESHIVTNRTSYEIYAFHNKCSTFTVTASRFHLVNVLFDSIINSYGRLFFPDKFYYNFPLTNFVKIHSAILRVSHEADGHTDGRANRHVKAKCMSATLLQMRLKCPASAGKQTQPSSLHSQSQLIMVHFSIGCLCFQGVE